MNDKKAGNLSIDAGIGTHMAVNRSLF